MSDRTPTEHAWSRLDDVEVAHRRIRNAWPLRPGGDLTPDRTVGPITGGERSDPTASGASAHDAARNRIIDELVRITLDLLATFGPDADAHTTAWLATGRYDTPTARQQKHGRVGDILKVHGQMFGRLAAHVRTVETQHGWDEAKALLVSVHTHAQAMVRASRWAEGLLVQPNATPGTTVCEDQGCQTVVTVGQPDDEVGEVERDHRSACPACQDHTLLCVVCAHRKHRAALRASERLDEIAVDRAAGRRCHGEVRECDRLLSDVDRDNNARNCAACRKHRERNPVERASDGTVAFTYRGG